MKKRLLKLFSCVISIALLFSVNILALAEDDYYFGDYICGGDLDVPVHGEIWVVMPYMLKRQGIYIDKNIKGEWDRAYEAKTNFDTNVWLIEDSVNYDDFYYAITHNEYGESTAISSCMEITGLANGDFRTGSLITILDPEFNVETRIAKSRDIAGGDDGLGDGIVDIVDVAVMRSMVINGTADTLKDDNYLIFTAFDGNEHPDGLCDIVDIARTRALIVKK